MDVLPEMFNRIGGCCDRVIFGGSVMLWGGAVARPIDSIGLLDVAFYTESGKSEHLFSWIMTGS
jgi:hypothetical protein